MKYTAGMFSIFDNIHICEQTFLKIKLMKFELSFRLTDDQILRLSVSMSVINIYIEKLYREV